MPDLIVASTNSHKVAELRRMLEGSLGVEISGLDRFPAVPEIKESAPTFAGNATLKAQGVASYLAGAGVTVGTWVLADDSGLSVDALDGAPGVYSARFAGPRATDAQNNRKLRDTLRARDLESSSAHYACVLALCRVDPATMPSPDVLLFHGRWDLEVRTVSRGEGGFGYDPHAWIDGRARTVAELSPPEKAARSHRGSALRELLRRWPARTT